MSLKPETVAALAEALDDEYKARATYAKVIERFGPVRPFVNIVQAEDRHAKAVLALYARYGLEAPADAWADSDRIQIPDTLTEACQLAVEGEIENMEMYDRLLAAVEEPDCRIVLENLQAASRDRHLPAFQRCVERGGDAGEPCGCGEQRGQGNGHRGRGSCRGGAGRRNGGGWRMNAQTAANGGA